MNEKEVNKRIGQFLVSGRLQVVPKGCHEQANDLSLEQQQCVRLINSFCRNVFEEPLHRYGRQHEKPLPDGHMSVCVSRLYPARINYYSTNEDVLYQTWTADIGLRDRRQVVLQLIPRESLH